MIGCHISEFNDPPKVVQIYTHNTKPYKEYQHASDLVAKLKDSEVKFYVHSTFNTVPGHNTFKFFMRDQFNCAQKLGASGIIVHIPNKPISEIVEAFDISIKQKNTIIYLEHIPGKYGNPKLLKLLYSQLLVYGLKFGICIDTCHIYSSGYDLGDEKIMADYLETIDSIGCPVLVHLNDSMGELGSGVDRHNTLGTKIWTRERCSSLLLLLQKKWDCIMEMDQEKYKESLVFVNYVLEMSGESK